MSVLAQMTRLLQLSCSSADVWTEEVWELDKDLGEKVLVDKMMVKLREPSWKVDAFMEILAERPGKQVVAFAPSRQLVDLAAERAIKDGYRVARIVGGQSATVRRRNLDDFQAGKADVICVTTSAGGVGITLTAASTGVFLQRPWSYVEASQAEDRLHRIGSERHESVDIIDIVAKKTIDARMREVLREKSAALADLVQDPRIVAECLGGIK
jgi:SNF2 family DNA or RNA helicase